MSKQNETSEQKEAKPAMLTIEEHAKTMQVDAAVFAAVMQSEGWAAGKRIPETVFKKAVLAFTGAPIKGR